MPDRLPEWLTGYLHYPGNGVAFKKLREVLHTRRDPHQPRVICFAGAGCSMPPLPGWGQLLSGMRDAALEGVRLFDQRTAIEALPALDSVPGKYLEFAEALKKITGPDDFFDLLKTRLTVPLSERAFTRTHAAISCLDVDGVVTTNFDFGLTKAQQRRFQLEPTLEGRLLDQPCEVGLAADACDNIEAWLKDGREFSFGGETNAPLYLHGSLVSPKDVVFTASDYDTFYKVEVGRNPNTGVFFFEQLLGNATLVFIGYSFTDPFIDTVLSKVAKRPVWQG
ncbi:MAG: SIR2 family protein, partial [Candidatus Korobacteraceae bacterium]